MLAFLAGAGLSVQAYVNGRLSQRIGSPELAALVNQTVGVAGLLMVAIAFGALARAWARIRAGARPRWWHPVASVNGALYVIVTSSAAPKVGVALLTVAIVSGQTGGGLVADRVGLSPSGRHALSPARALGVALAVGAVTLAAFGRHGEPHLALLLLAVVAGAGMAVVQSGMGHITRITGEPLAASLVSFSVGGLCVLVVALVVTGGSPPNGWSAPPELWVGGVIGAATAVVMALTVTTLGVLRLTLSIVAGQVLGGLLVDLVAPAAGAPVSVRTVATVALTLVAVAVSGGGLHRRLPVRMRRRERSGPEGTPPPGCPTPSRPE